MVDKSSLRSEVRAQRRQRPTAAHATAAAAFARNWRTLARIADHPDLLLSFQPTGTEPDPREITYKAWESGLPVWIPRPSQGGTLDWVVATGEHFTERQKSVPTPNGPRIGTGAQALIGRKVLVLTPALAVDPANGTRLGHGGGYYDRLLAQARTLGCCVTTVALVFSDELRALPVETHDQPVDYVLTELMLSKTGLPV